MHLLVSCCNVRALGLPALGLLDVATSEFKVLQLPTDLPPLGGITGLAASGAYLFVAVQPAFQPGKKGPPLLLVLDRHDLAIRNRHAFREALDVHSLWPAGDALYAVSTGTDEVVELRLRGPAVLSERVFWRLPGGGPRTGFDVHHLNAITARGEELLVSGFGPRTGPWWNSATDGFIYNVTRNERMASGLDQPHSLAVLDDQVAFCESRKKTVRLLDNSRAQALPGYTRGLCLVGRHLYAGASVGRRVSRSTGILNNPTDAGPQAGRCAIVQLSADSLAVEKRIDLGSGVQEIYDLLPVEGAGDWPTVPERVWHEAALRDLVTALDQQTSRARRAEEALADQKGMSRNGMAGKEPHAHPAASPGDGARDSPALLLAEMRAQAVRLRAMTARVRRLARCQARLRSALRRARDEGRRRDEGIYSRLYALSDLLRVNTFAAPAAPGGEQTGATITATPVTAPTGSDTWGTTTISWDTGDGSVGQVYVASNGRPETLFAEKGPKGSLLAPWIGKGEYEFRLYAGREHKRVLARVKVTGQGPYPELIRRIRQVVRDVVPADATLLVVSRGDGELLDLYGRRAWHFPRGQKGVYAGYNPGDSTAAIAHLEALRSRGGAYLLFPATALWWLDHYGTFRTYLERQYHLVHRDDACCLFALQRRLEARTPARPTLEQVLAEFQERFQRDPAILDWQTGLDLARVLPGHAVFSPPTRAATLPYLDETIDVVALAAPGAGALAEARRVASGLVVVLERTTGRRPDLRARVDWKVDRPASASPPVSLVLPCSGGWPLVRASLRALGETIPADFQGEILVVAGRDSRDAVARLRLRVRNDRRFRILWEEDAAGFSPLCNRAAQQATGDYLIFLPPGFLPVPDWLAPLVRLFRERPLAGVVGGKVLGPDGRLLGAGGMVFKDGSLAGFGQDDYHPEAGLFSHVREIDMGAIPLVTPRSLFLGLGGFNSRYRSPCYAGADYCMRVKAAGSRVYCQPESLVVQRAAEVLDKETSLRRCRLRFAREWGAALQNRPARPDSLDSAAWQALAVWPEQGVPSP